MFDGTDLNLVYGDMNQDMLSPPQMQSNKPVKQAQIPPDTNYNVPDDVYQQQEPKVIYKQEPSFWEKLGNNKNEVYKLFLFALVILLAIAIDKFIFFYFKSYLDDTILNSTNEFLFRLSYPVSILIVLWILKTL
tara:strand:+ start:4668 stop:5069 length:402 start_codon:yes stop_codon:yes gene_type:complete